VNSNALREVGWQINVDRGDVQCEGACVHWSVQEERVLADAPGVCAQDVIQHYDGLWPLHVESFAELTPHVRCHWRKGYRNGLPMNETVLLLECRMLRVTSHRGCDLELSHRF
jgi:hypothetical protein